MAVNDTLWVKTHESLRQFMKTLTCKKCGGKLSNPKQFLNCGHFVCSECVGLKTNCVQCQIPGEASDIHLDTAMNDLIINLNIIAKAVGSLEEKPSEFKFENPKPPLEVTDDCNQSVRRQSSRRNKKSNKMLDDTNMSLCESVFSRISHRSKASESIPKNINKKNKKGETALHIACRSDQIERVKKLLGAGANPNTKDNAGWTPLQEAASYEYTEVCEELLKHDAQPNMYGCDNRTALHESVISNNCELALLLLKAYANKKVFDSNGKKPIDYCKSKEMSELLQSFDDSTEKQAETSPEPNKTQQLDKTVDQSMDTKIVLYGSKNLKQQNCKLLKKMGNEKKGIKVVKHFSPSVTHVIVDTDNTSNIAYSLDVLFTVLYGKILVNSNGLPILMESNNITPTDLSLFEVNPPQLDDSLTRSRENIFLQRPKLFNNCFFYFAIKQHDNIDYDAAMKLTKNDLMSLVAAGDGIALTREPKPDDIQGSLSPFHVANNPKHALHKCTHYIIFDPQNTQSNANRIMYNMPTLKTLPLLWFIESILRFQLIDPVDMGLVEP